jgi:hypothetical protein
MLNSTCCIHSGHTILPVRRIGCRIKANPCGARLLNMRERIGYWGATAAKAISFRHARSGMSRSPISNWRVVGAPADRRRDSHSASIFQAHSRRSGWSAGQFRPALRPVRQGSPRRHACPPPISTCRITAPSARRGFKPLLRQASRILMGNQSLELFAHRFDSIQIHEQSDIYQ